MDRFDLAIHPLQLLHWPQYKDFLFSFDLNVPDSEAHAHIPFVAILAQLSAKFMQTHDGKLPTGKQQIDEFKSLIKVASRNGLNFVEAEQYWYHAVKHPSERVFIDRHSLKTFSS